MRFFPKLLILLTSIALIPLFCVILFDWTVHKHLSTEISAYASSLLIREAAGMLEQAVEAYARMAKEQGQMVETIVEIQAREMERLLALPPPVMQKVYFSEDYDRGTVPGMVAASPKYDRVGSDANLIHGKISLTDVDFDLAPEVDRESVADDIARLAAMAPVYKTLYGRHSRIIMSLYTALESGVISSYPGTGGYPEDYDPRVTSWYKITKDADGLVWNPPAVDETGMGILAGVGRPVRWPDGSFAGVTALDVSNIQELPTTLPHAPWTSDLQVFLALVDTRPDTHEGGLRMIGIKDYHKEMKDWRTPLKEVWLESGDQEKHREMLREIQEGKSGTIRMPFADRDSLWAYGLLDEGITALIFIVPMENIVSKAREMRAFVLGEEDRELAFFGVIAMLAIGVVIFFSYLGSRTIANPLRTLSEATGEIAAGNLDVPIPTVTSRDEVGELTRSVALMKNELKEYIAKLTQATASRERIESELRIARQIQMSFLPQEFPQPPHGTEFSIFAAIQPAREVGGDLYDLFLVDNTSLFFAIGDVSGKGIPAALYMAMTKTLMKGIAREQRDPHVILTAMNKELAKGNETCMFVTFFCGLLNTCTGEVLFCNAGHNPPLLIRAQEEATFLQTEKTLILGIFEEAQYKTETIHLGPGDSLLLYTDGVTEATNEEDEFYTAAKFQKDVCSLRGFSPEETIAGVMDKLHSFCGCAPQADDITMLMIRFNGPC